MTSTVSFSPVLPTPHTLIHECEKHIGAPISRRLVRESDLDLVFTGYKVASGRCGDREFERDWTRWTVVTLYVTAAGKFVVGIDRHSRWQGQSDRHDATVHDTFAEVRRFLTDDNDGKLGPASKEMIEEAAETLPSLAGEDVVQIA